MKKLLTKSVALDSETFKILKEIKKRFKSTSKAIREAINFYYKNKELKSWKGLSTCIEMLTGRVILDIDHWIVFLNFIETHPEKEKFWEIHKEIAKSYADEFKNRDIDYIIERLSVCNLFKFTKKDDEYILILNNERTKRFVRDLLLEILNTLEFNVSIKEDLMKLKIEIDRKNIN